MLVCTTRPLYRPAKHHFPHLDKILINMLEHDEMPYFGYTSTVNSTGSYEDYHYAPAEVYPPTIYTHPSHHGFLNGCPSALQSITPSFAYGYQTLEPPQYSFPRSLEPWASSNSENVGDPYLAGSSWGYPMPTAAPQTAIPSLGHARSISSLSGYSATYPSEAQQGTLPSFVYSLHDELERLQFSNPVQQGHPFPSHAAYTETGSGSEPVIASAERAKDLAFRNVSKATENAAPIPGVQACTPHQMNPPPEVARESSFMTQDWNHPHEGGTEPDTTLEATVEDFPYQNTPTQWVSAKPENGDAGHLVVEQNYTRSSSPQTCVSKQRQRKLYKFVSERVDSPEKGKRSREKRSTACDECNRCKVKCTGEIHSRSCQRCYKRNRHCTWNKRSGMDEGGNIRFKHCRAVQA